MSRSTWIPSLLIALAASACATEAPPDSSMPPIQVATPTSPRARPQLVRADARARYEADQRASSIAARRAELGRLLELLERRGYSDDERAAVEALFERDVAGRLVARGGVRVVERVDCVEVAAVLGETSATTLLAFDQIFSCSPGRELAARRAENLAWSRYIATGDTTGFAELPEATQIQAHLATGTVTR